MLQQQFKLPQESVGWLSIGVVLGVNLTCRQLLPASDEMNMPTLL